MRHTRAQKGLEKAVAKEDIEEVAKKREKVVLFYQGKGLKLAKEARKKYKPRSKIDGYASDYLKENNLTHFWNYPRSPKSNAYIERFNRTIKEQFVYRRIA
jgi:hypothetical protein